MPNSFSRKLSQNVSNTFSVVGGYSVNAATQVTVIGLTVANKVSSQILVDVVLNAGTSNTHLVKEAPVPSGGSIVLVGGDQKVVMEPTDRLLIRSDTANSADVVMSVLEIT
jgi:hypothetical protein